MYLDAGDEIAVRDTSRSSERFRELEANRSIPNFLTFDASALQERL